MKQRVTITVPRQIADKAIVFDPRAGRAFQSPIDAIEITFEGERIDVEVEDLERYVQVEFLDAHPVHGTLTHQLYTYRDNLTDVHRDTRTRALRVGDIVDVPTCYQRHNRAIVRKLGSNISPTAQTKYVAARLYLEAE
jgi:hypothetical protein